MIENKKSPCSWLACLLLSCSLFVFCSSNLVAQEDETPAQAALNKATETLNNGNLPEATKQFEAFVKEFPSDPLTPTAELQLGLCQMFSSNFDRAIEIFTKSNDKRNPAIVRDTALQLLAQTQFNKAGSMPQKDAARPKLLKEAKENFSTHLKDFPKSDMRESAYYGRALASYYLEEFDAAVADIQALLKEFPQTENKPDYLLLVGGAYATQTVRMSQDEARRSEAIALSERALQAFDQIKDGGDSAVVANDAALQAADMLFSLAQGPDDYKASMLKYRRVRPKSEVLKLQEGRVASLRARTGDAVRMNARGQIEVLRRKSQKEVGRLAELKNRPDPGVTAQIRVASCLRQTRRLDEARVLLKRLLAFTEGEQKRELSNQIILTYAMQGLTAKASEAFAAHRQMFPDDPQIDNVQVIVGEELIKAKDFQAAADQFNASMKDFPQGRYFASAVLGVGKALVGLGKTDEAIKTIQDFIAKNKDHPRALEAELSLAEAYVQKKDLESALKHYRSVGTNTKAGLLQPAAAFQAGKALLDAKRYDEAIAELDAFVKNFGKTEIAPTAKFVVGMAKQSKGDIPGAVTTFEELAKQFPEHNLAPDGLETAGRLLMQQRDFTNAVRIYEKLIADFPKSSKVNAARFALAAYFQGQKQYDKAAEYYNTLSMVPGLPTAPTAVMRKLLMWMEAGKSVGSYKAIIDKEKSLVELDAKAIPEEKATIIKQKALNEADKKSWADYYGKAEESIADMMTKFPAAPEVADALEEMIRMGIMRAEAGLVEKDKADTVMQPLAEKFAGDPLLKTRIELAKGGLMYELGNKEKALEILQAAAQAGPDSAFGAKSLNRYGLLLLAKGKQDDAIGVFKKMQAAFPKDQYAQADSMFGLGQAHLDKKMVAEADVYFSALRQKYPWSDRINEADYGRGLAAIERKQYKEARDILTTVIRAPKSKPEQKAKSMLAFAEACEKDNLLFPDPANPTVPNAVNNYQKISVMFERETGPAGEGLWRAGQLFEKNSKPEDARKAYSELTAKFSQHPRVAEAQQRLAALPAAPAQ
jgi:TolA-binding protein